MKKSVLFLLILLTLVLTGLRGYQLLSLTQPDTGFLTVFDWSGYVFYILLALGIVALPLLAALPRQRDEEVDLGGTGCVGRGVALCLVGLATAAENVLSLLRLLEDRTVEFWGWHVALAVGGLLTAMYLLGLAAVLLRRKTPRCFPLLALLPGAWLACRALLTYLSARAVVTVPAKVLSILLMVFVAVWWLAHARLHSGVDSPKGQRILTALTPVCLMLIVISVLPSSFAALVAGSAVSPVTFSDITHAVMAPYILLTVLPRKPFAPPEAVSDLPPAPEPPEEMQ